MFPGGVSSADPWPYPAESELPSYVPTAEVPGGEETLTSTSCVPSIPRTIAKQSRAMPRCSEYPKSLKTTDSLQQDSTRCEPFRAFERKFSVTNNQVSDTGLRHLNSKSKDLQTVIESRTESEAEVQLASQCIGTRSLDSGFPSSGCRFPSNGCQSSEYVYTTSVPVLRPSHPESQETSSFGTASNQCTSGYSPAVPSSLAGVLLSPENLLAKSLAPLVPSPLTRRSARIPALQPGKPGAPGFPSSTVPSLNISSRRERRWQAYPSPTLGHSPFPEVSNGHEGTLGSSNLCATCSATTVLPTLLTPQQHYSEATKRSISHSFSPDEGSRSSSAYTPFSSHGEESSRSEPSLKSEALSILSLDPLKAEDLTVIDLDNIGVSLSVPIPRYHKAEGGPETLPSRLPHRSSHHHITDSANFASCLSQFIPSSLLKVFGVSEPAVCMETRDILKDVTGTLLPGRLVALLGPSGAGKSTLLNVLAGRLPHSSGELRFNGRIVMLPEDARRHSAYIQQLDMFLPNLTVEEHLDSQILLRLGSVPREQRRNLIDDVVTRFGLTKCKKTVIGGAESGISGGERKRLTVASEVLTNPQVLLADEPTTGIDSFMAVSVIATLRKLAGSGRSVIASLHQPSTQLFAMFDEVMLMAEGRVLYFGDRMGSIEWFRRLGLECPKLTNPADFLIKSVSLLDHPSYRTSKLSRIIEWAELWKSEGDAFLQQWTDCGRFKFFESSKTFAERSIEMSLSQSTRPSPNVSAQSQESVPAKVIPWEKESHFFNKKDKTTHDEDRNIGSGLLQTLPYSPLPASQSATFGRGPPFGLHKRSAEAVLKTFIHFSPRTSRREPFSLAKRRCNQTSIRGSTSSSPGSKLINKHATIRSIGRMRRTISTGTKRLNDCGNPDSLSSNVKSPPTFGLCSRVKSVPGIMQCHGGTRRQQQHQNSSWPFKSAEMELAATYSKKISPWKSIDEAMTPDWTNGSEAEIPSSSSPKTATSALHVLPQKPTAWFQFCVLLTRALASNGRDRIVVHARALQTIFIALSYGSIFFRLGNSIEDSKSKLSAIFFVLTNQGLVGAVAVCSTFICEKVVIRREIESGIIRITPYIVAKIVADVPIQTFFPIVFNGICFWMMGLHDDWARFALSCIVALMVCNAAISVGYLGSATAPNTDQALITAQIWVLPALLFGGYAVKLDDIPAPISPLQYLSYFRYGYIAYSYLAFSGTQVDFHHPKGVTYSGEEFVKAYVGLNLNGLHDFWIQILWLGVMILIFRLLIVLLVVPASKRWRENK